MNTEQCRLRVAAFVIPQKKVTAYWYENVDRYFYRFQFDKWIDGPKGRMGRFIRVAPRPDLLRLQSHATQEA
jgi:hypothetical protein